MNAPEIAVAHDQDPITSSCRTANMIHQAIETFRQGQACTKLFENLLGVPVEIGSDMDETLI